MQNNIYNEINQANRTIRWDKKQLQYLSQRQGNNEIVGQQVKRLFDIPLVATEEAAMSPECLACKNRGRECLFVR